MLAHSIPTIPIAEKDIDNFHFFYQPQYWSQVRSLYKLRLNIHDKDYTDENKAAISSLLCGLMQKYSSAGGILAQFKYHTLPREEVDDSKRKVLFWEAMKLADPYRPQEIVNQIHNPKTKETYTKYLATHYEEKKLDEIIQNQKAVFNSRIRLRGQAQFTLYLDFIRLNSQVAEPLIPPPSIDCFTQPICLLQFLRELDEGLKNLRIRPGTLDETDSKVFSFISFRQEKMNQEEKYVAHNADKRALNLLKKEQKACVLFKFIKSCLQYPASYRKMWEAQEKPLDKILALLNDYTKGDHCGSDVSLFLTGHVFFGKRRHHVKEVRSLIKRIHEENLQVADILQALNELVAAKLASNFNFGGTLFRLISFIQERCMDEDLNPKSEAELALLSKGRALESKSA